MVSCDRWNIKNSTKNLFLKKKKKPNACIFMDTRNHKLKKYNYEDLVSLFFLDS